MRFKAQSESGEPQIIDAESPSEAAEVYAQTEFDQGEPFTHLRVRVESMTAAAAVYTYTVLVDMSPTFAAFPFGAEASR